MAHTTRERGIRSKYLRLRDLWRLEHVFFTGSRIVEGQYSGQHATLDRGSGVEFQDYRQYIPGDEISNVDWKVYGRSDKLFIKIFEHQAELTVNLLVDASASMAYQGLPGFPGWQEDSKYDYACRLAASFAFLIIKQHDRVAFGFAQRGLTQFQPAQRSMLHLKGILRSMGQMRAEGEAHLAQAVSEISTQGRRRELIVLISDLLDEPDDVMKAVSVHSQRGGEVIIFHVVHADELSLPQVDNGIFIDSETAARVRASVADLRADYKARMKRFLDTWSKWSRGTGAAYTRCTTSEPYDRVLDQFLSSRIRKR